MGGHGAQTALISAKIVIARVTNRRVHFDMLLLIKMYQLRSAGLQERGKSNHIPKGSVLTFSSEELGGRAGGKPSVTGRVDSPPGPSFPDSVYSLRFPPHSSHAQTSRKASQSKKKLFHLELTFSPGLSYWRGKGKSFFATTPCKIFCISLTLTEQYMLE